MMAKPLNVAIVAGAWPHYGRWTSFVYHLVQGFDALDIEYRIIAAGGACRHWTDRILFEKERYLSDADVVLVSFFYPTFQGLDHQRHLMSSIKKSGKPVSVLMMGPDEWEWDGATECLKYLNPEHFLFTGAESLRRFRDFNREWVSRARLSLVKLPYKRWTDGRELEKGGRVICTSRIIPESRIEKAIQVEGVEIWSSAPGSRSVYGLEIPGGSLEMRPEYKGGYEMVTEDLYRVYGSSSALVEMARLTGEGGRVKYTLLEAMDFGLSIVGASDWSCTADAELQPGTHYFPALEPEEIRAALESLRIDGNPHRAAQERILNDHEAAKVAGEIMERWNREKDPG